VSSAFGFGRDLELSFAAAVDRVTDELAAEGFGILTDIDVAATMKKKLNKDMRPYRILGACNPGLAYQAIDMLPDIGLLLPCNVVARESETGRVHVRFLDPVHILGLADAEALEPFAAEVRRRLERVAARL